MIPTGKQNTEGWMIDSLVVIGWVHEGMIPTGMQNTEGWPDGDGVSAWRHDFYRNGGGGARGRIEPNIHCSSLYKQTLH